MNARHRTWLKLLSAVLVEKDADSFYVVSCPICAVNVFAQVRDSKPDAESAAKVKMLKHIFSVHKEFMDIEYGSNDDQAPPDPNS